MKTKLCFAVVAASLAAAPVALAQSYDNNASRAPSSSSSSSSGATDSPAVRSLPGVQPEPWREGTTSYPNRDMSGMSNRVMDQDAVSGSTGGVPNRMMERDGSGSTGGAAMDRDVTGTSNRATSNRSMPRDTTMGNTTRSEAMARRGRGQNDLELSQTTLLNQFSAAGYTMVRDFRKEGDRYVARAQDRDGRWSSVELDPRAGTITPR